MKYINLPIPTDKQDPGETLYGPVHQVRDTARTKWFLEKLGQAQIEIIREAKETFDNGAEFWWFETSIKFDNMSQARLEISTDDLKAEPAS